MRKIRTLFLFIVFALWAAIILGRLFYLQIIKGEYYQALAFGQQVSLQDSLAQRGDIFFNDGKNILAQNVLVPVLYIFPDQIPESDKEQIVQTLASVLGEDVDIIAKQVESQNVIKREINNEQYKILRAKNFKGVSLSQTSLRVYPYKSLAAHITGFVNREGRGQYGVEEYYDDILRGNDVVAPKNYFLAIWNNLFSNQKNDWQTKGKSLSLTIDFKIQSYAQKLLEEAFEQWKMDSGQIIVQEPQSGKILAMAFYPEFDPNRYYEQKHWDIFMNNALQTLFEPGSVFKPFTMAAGLEESLITPQTVFVDKGFVEVGGPPIYNFGHREWGTKTMIGVLENSINTGAVFVEQKLGRNLFWQYIQKFGFLEKTNIDLAGEVFSNNTTLKNGYPRDFASASFGQGVQITSLQLLRAFSAIANEGKMMRPYIVEKIIDTNGKEKIVEPVLEKQMISQDTAAKITAMLVSVVENGGGRRARVPRYYMAGKTGTAQIPKPSGGYYENETIQSFIGFGPAFSPRFVILVRLDNPKQSDVASSCAAPIFSKMAKYIIDLWEIPPDEQPTINN